MIWKLLGIDPSTAQQIGIKCNHLPVISNTSSAKASCIKIWLCLSYNLSIPSFKKSEVLRLIGIECTVCQQDGNNLMEGSTLTKLSVSIQPSSACYFTIVLLPVAHKLTTSYISLLCPSLDACKKIPAAV